ncbi:MAG: hypothetical protein IPK21_15870 [Haliscomenobacter sp.]|nr:hypothetical protein [Haliscomenobacter sp.]
MRLWYNGYRFEEAETVYNPVSCNLFFNKRSFKIFGLLPAHPLFWSTS